MRLRALAATAVAAALTLVPAAVGADGDLDPGFGNGGIVVTSVANAQASARSVVVQADGKYVTAGQLFLFGAGGLFGVHRYNADGTLDNGFGENGIATFGFGSLGAAAHAVGLMPDGDIFVGGTSFDFATGLSGAIARLNSDGTLDAGFDGDGTRLVSGGLNDLVVDGSGRVVISSSVFPDSTITVTRFLADGSVDTSFGTAGTTTVAVGSEGTGGGALAVTPSGHILVSGNTRVAGSFRGFVARLMPDGSLDTSFGASGHVVLDFGGVFSTAGRMTLDADGGILVAGQRATGPIPEGVVARVSGEGAIVTSFGSDGYVVVPHFNTARALAQRDGSIVAVGTSGDPIVNRAAFSAVRMRADGVFDATFGGDGVVETEVGANAFVSSGVLTQHGVTLVGQNATSAVLVRYTIMLSTPFASFAPRVTSTQTSIEFKARFALGSGSNGIDPAAEGIEIELGPHAAFIDGSTLRAGKGAWKYEGPLLGATADVQLVETGEGAYELKLVLSGVAFSPPAPLEVRIRIGDDEGSAVARLDD